ncbi:hypothetical protein RSK20926_20545 [Roseobacter sp. SK209-2-6]|nr:hypothetical protein RSK20926_20545 [Roseobacter sp. SK209-2-6]
MAFHPLLALTLAFRIEKPKRKPLMEKISKSYECGSPGRRIHLMDLRVSLLPAIRHLKQMSEVIEFDE